MEESFQHDPFSYVDVKYVPAFLLQLIAEKFLMREPEKLYELQVEYNKTLFYCVEVQLELGCDAKKKKTNKKNRPSSPTICPL